MKKNPANAGSGSIPAILCIFLARGAVFCIKELRLNVAVETHTTGRERSEQVKKVTRAQKAAELFAAQFAAHLREMSVAFPVLKRLKILYDLVGIAEGVRELRMAPKLTFLLDDYRPAHVETPGEYQLFQLYGFVERSDGAQHLIYLSGGIQLKTELKWLNYGDVSRLRDVVVKTRPSRETLSWALPLQGWKMPNSQDLEPEVPSDQISETLAESGAIKVPGCSVCSQSFVLNPAGANSAGNGRHFQAFNPLVAPPATFARDAPTMRLNGVLISPRPLKDPSALDDDFSGRVLRGRPNQKSTHWKIEGPNLGKEAMDD
jgi:hypothetical protein